MPSSVRAETAPVYGGREVRIEAPGVWVWVARGRHSRAAIPVLGKVYETESWEPVAWVHERRPRPGTGDLADEPYQVLAFALRDVYVPDLPFVVGEPVVVVGVLRGRPLAWFVYGVGRRVDLKPAWATEREFLEMART